MHRLALSLLLLCACGAAADKSVTEEPPLCRDLRAFAASKVSQDSPCPPASCSVTKAGVNCGPKLATQPANTPPLACTTFTAGDGCQEVCPPAQCSISTVTGLEVCDDGGPSRCGASVSTCYALAHASDCPN